MRKWWCKNISKYTYLRDLSFKISTNKINKLLNIRMGAGVSCCRFSLRFGPTLPESPKNRFVGPSGSVFRFSSFFPFYPARHCSRPPTDWLLPPRPRFHLTPSLTNIRRVVTSTSRTERSQTNLSRPILIPLTTLDIFSCSRCRMRLSTRVCPS